MEFELTPEEQRIALLEAYYTVFSTEAGEKVLAHLNQVFWNNELSTYRSDISVEDMVFCEGQRYVVNFINKQIQTFREVVNGTRN